MSNPTLINPDETASQMYSKCIVDPLSRHPIEMTALKGAVDGPEEALSPAFDWAGEAGLSVSMSERRLVVLAIMLGAALADWVLPPSMRLEVSARMTRGRGRHRTTIGAETGHHLAYPCDFRSGFISLSCSSGATTLVMPPSVHADDLLYAAPQSEDTACPTCCLTNNPANPFVCISNTRITPNPR